MKTCAKCKVEKEFSEFHNDKKGKDGRFSRCKDCAIEEMRKYREKNREKLSQKQREYYKNNKEKCLDYANKQRSEKKEYYTNYMAEYYENNRDKVLNQQKQYREKNKKKKSAYQIAWEKERRDNDPLYKLKGNLRSRTGSAFRRNGFLKETKTRELLGEDWEVVKSHIEKQFTKGMTWSNHGKYGWHIDHKIPLSSAKTEEELIKLCHYTNLQPLWAEDNLRKGGKIIT